MELSPEDILRLNVLLAGDVQAIRIDESTMTVFGLSVQGEAKIQLNPTCRDDQYVRLVRETISGHVLGSPGGYPVYLRRWTRMGQAREGSLKQLLKLGEPEAVAAVVHAPGLTEELARRAWWASPTAENARSMLRQPSVAQTSIGRVLADYLADYLPFEEDPSSMVDTVRLVLQPGLIDEAKRDAIWTKGRHNNAYHVGFLFATPDDLPEPPEPRADWAESERILRPLADAGNAFAERLVHVLSGPGQAFLGAAERVLRKPADQDVVLLLFEAVANYFAPARVMGNPEADLPGVIAESERCCADTAPSHQRGLADLAQVKEAAPQYISELQAMLVLARLGYPMVRPVFSRTTAVGGLMRRKLEPVTAPIFQQLAVLQGQPAKRPASAD